MIAVLYLAYGFCLDFIVFNIYAGADLTHNILYQNMDSEVKPEVVIVNSSEPLNDVFSLFKIFDFAYRFNFESKQFEFRNTSPASIYFQYEGFGTLKNPEEMVFYQYGSQNIKTQNYPDYIAQIKKYENDLNQQYQISAYRSAYNQYEAKLDLVRTNQATQELFSELEKYSTTIENKKIFYNPYENILQNEKLVKGLVDEQINALNKISFVIPNDYTVHDKSNNLLYVPSQIYEKAFLETSNRMSLYSEWIKNKQYAPFLFLILCFYFLHNIYLTYNSSSPVVLKGLNIYRFKENDDLFFNSNFYNKDILKKINNILEEIKIASSYPFIPSIYCIDSDDINCFSSIIKDKFCIFITKGALLKTTRDELMIMLSHELSHLKNNDHEVKNMIMGILEKMRVDALVLAGGVITLPFMLATTKKGKHQVGRYSGADGAVGLLFLGIIFLIILPLCLIVGLLLAFNASFVFIAKSILNIYLRDVSDYRADFDSLIVLRNNKAFFDLFEKIQKDEDENQYQKVSFDNLRKNYYFFNYKKTYNKVFDITIEERKNNLLTLYT